MRKYKSAYLKPYIRKAKKQVFYSSNASDIMVCIAMSAYEHHKGDVYILTQRGTNKVIEIGSSKETIKRRLLAVSNKKNNHRCKKFNSWRNGIKIYCQKQ